MKTLDQAKQCLLRLLARRDHSQLELKRKLLTKGYDASIVQQALAYSAEKNWLNEERFADSYVQMRKRCGYGPVRIQAELQERGISAELIEKFLNSSEEDWYAQLVHLMKKKFKADGSKFDLTWPERVKQMRFLQYRGFTPSQIKRILNDKSDHEYE